ncbi:hypothetical protein AAY473_036926 [Plecturocebus cupreus]
METRSPPSRPAPPERLKRQPAATAGSRRCRAFPTPCTLRAPSSSPGRGGGWALGPGRAAGTQNEGLRSAPELKAGANALTNLIPPFLQTSSFLPKYKEEQPVASPVASPESNSVRPCSEREARGAGLPRAGWDLGRAAKREAGASSSGRRPCFCPVPAAVWKATNLCSLFRGNKNLWCIVPSNEGQSRLRSHNLLFIPEKYGSIHSGKTFSLNPKLTPSGSPVTHS